MSETQNIEYKSSWHDDYLKWVCGFANAQGGKIYIGMNDAATVVGLPDQKTLMEEIPNKIKNNMGITAEVNLLQDGELYYIEIVVQSYSVPISLRGRYYYRSGSVKQELTGVALSEFLLKKAGQTWDNMPEERATIADIDENTIKKYLRKAETGGRLPDVDGLTTEELLEKLRLAENGKLKRAAIVLFGKDPGKFYPNTFVKIGKFDDDDFTIRFQEVEEGNVIEVLEKVLRTLDYKFLIKNISFEGMNRVETLEYPVPALREMLLNSLIHRNYMGAPTQLRVYDHKLQLWNHGTLPVGITLEKLSKSHSSFPRNPILAEACFKGSYIDSWGSGIMKIVNSCKAAGLPTPTLEEDMGGFMVKLFKDIYSEEELKNKGLNERQIEALSFFKSQKEITTSEYVKKFKITDRTARRDLVELVEKELLISEGENKSVRYIYK
ncbi:ATP-dependent DNA helicase [Bacteroidia bacterium]|nr:ATP-dependent DNA helicase [Bacteroidia bacterium]